MPTVFRRRKNQTFYSSGTHFLSKNKDFDNDNSLRMTQPAWPALKGEGGIWARERACGPRVVSRPNSLSLPFHRRPRRLRMTEQGDISPCYITKPGSLEPLNIFILITFHYIYRTSMLSFGGCLQETKPILRYFLDECLNV